ncbi:MAG TPA: hypothetical protein VG222_07835 [Vicinamibacterales bacterium]|nr:hypothetical protein [Vicinamibacterales bacterium]
MALILAIEPDQRQAAQIAGIARHRLNAELILADTTERALDAIADRVPDLVLIPALLSPQDDASLAAALRVIAAAANVRTLTIPVLASAAPREARRTILGRWRRARESQTPDGCDPAVFAEQISTYLAEAVAERATFEPEPPIDRPVAGTAIAPDSIFEPAVSAILDRAAPAIFEPRPAAIVEPMRSAIFEPIASPIEPPVFVFQPAVAAVEHAGDPDVFARPISTYVAETVTEHPVLEPAPAIAERFFEPPPTVADFVFEPMAAVEATPIAAASVEEQLVEPAPAVDDFVFEPEAIVDATPILADSVEDPLVDPAPAVADFVFEPEAIVEATPIVAASVEEPLVEPAPAVAEFVFEPEAIVEATPIVAASVEEPLTEQAADFADFVFEPAAAVESTILAFPPAFSRVELPAVSAVPDAFDETAFVVEVSAQTLEDVDFDVADIIEIDLSDETLGHVADEEPVFELSMDDGADEFAIEDPRPIHVPLSLVVSAEAETDTTPELDVVADIEEPKAASDFELWMPLSVGAARLWPAIEGVASEFVDLSIVPAAAPAAPKSEHPEWTELIASLRQDMERRRDPVAPTPITRVVPRRKSKPVQDEWGFFDPQQCGFAALLAKLDEITEASDEQPASRLA